MSDAAKMMAYDAKKKSPAVAYILWIFLGGLGAHRFYAGHSGTGWIYVVLQVIGWVTVSAGIGMLVFIIIGIWWLVDAFLIPGMVRNKNLLLAAELTSGSPSSPS